MADPKPPQNDKGKKARSFGPYALFLFVLLAAMMGWIRPGGLPLMR